MRTCTFCRQQGHDVRKCPDKIVIVTRRSSPPVSTRNPHFLNETNWVKDPNLGLTIFQGPHIVITQVVKPGKMTVRLGSKVKALKTPYMEDCQIPEGSFGIVYEINEPIVGESESHFLLHVYWIEQERRMFAGIDDIDAEYPGGD